MDESQVYDWVNTLNVSRGCRYSCIGELRGFLRGIQSTKQSEETLCCESLIAWLRPIRNQMPERLGHRLYFVNRFLQWREQQGLGENFVARVCREHGIKIFKLVKILLSPNYKDLLSQCHPPTPPWSSWLGPVMQDRVERMRGLGFKYTKQEEGLLRLDRFLLANPYLNGASLKVIGTTWRESTTSKRTRLDFVECLRAISLEQARRNPDVIPIERDRVLMRQVIREERKPFVFTEQELSKLLQLAAEPIRSGDPVRPALLQAMVVILSCTGMRFGELMALRLQDADLESDLFEVRKAKFYKSRQVPFSASVRAALDRYLAVRARAGASQDGASRLWWSSLRRQHLSQAFAAKLLTRLIRRAGLKPQRGRKGPRIHDLRHTFATHRIQKYYREGANPQNRLQYLATYLGHKDIVSSLIYLHPTDEILENASNRLRALARSKGIGS